MENSKGNRVSFDSRMDKTLFKGTFFNLRTKKLAITVCMLSAPQCAAEFSFKINLNITNKWCDAETDFRYEDLAVPPHSAPALWSSHLVLNVWDKAFFVCLVVFFCSNSGRQLLPWVWGARLWIHGYIIHRQRPKNNGEKKQQLRTQAKTFRQWMHQPMITYHMPWKVLYRNIKKWPSTILILTYMGQQDRVLMINFSSGYFRFIEEVSSSFRTNFFLRASEIRVAESSSLRDVQPLLYLKWDPTKKYKPNDISIVQVCQDTLLVLTIIKSCVRRKTMLFQTLPR